MPSTLATTTGATNGLQSVFATLSAIPGNTYLIDEAMAAGSATVTFQVIVDPGTLGPISNTASVAFTYTVDPAMLDGASGTGTTVSTPVNFVDVSGTKTASPAGGIITYMLTLNNERR